MTSILLVGIDVGHQFLSRCEMVAVGIHHHWQSGIDFIGKTSQEAKKAVVNLIPYNVAYALMLTIFVGSYER